MQDFKVDADGYGGITPFDGPYRPAAHAGTLRDKVHGQLASLAHHTYLITNLFQHFLLLGGSRTVPLCPSRAILYLLCLSACKIHVL